MTSTPNLFNGAPRPEARIGELLELLAEDWKRSGPDQRFFQYLENLKHRLGLPADAYNVDDQALISHIAAGPRGNEPRQAG